MSEQEKKEGVGKSILILFLFLVIAFAYYTFIDWALMTPIQNLPFPFHNPWFWKGEGTG